MKILFYTDPHFCQYSSLIRGRGNKYSIRLENEIKSINWAEQLAVDNHCNEIICGGDFFDTATLNAEEITALNDIQFANYIHHTFIVGNHEIGLNNDIFSTAHIFSCFDFDVIDKPTTIRVDGLHDIMLLPYILESNRSTIGEYCESLNIKNPIIFSHNDIAGIQMGQFMSTVGFNIDDIENNCTIFINGHLHNGQKITNKIINVGNLTGQNFSEDGFRYSHNAMIFDTETLEYEMIENPYAFYFYKMDFTTKSDIDYINEISSQLKNAIVSILCKESDYEYIKNRFDPNYNTNNLIPKNCNIIQSRIQVQREVNNNNIVEKKEELNNINHITRFNNYILSTIGSDSMILEELERISK